MIYDRALTIYDLDAPTPLQGTLIDPTDFLCAPREVFFKRFWEAVQAGTEISEMVELPLHHPVTTAQLAAFNGEIWRIVQVQHGQDKDGLPITTLSLSRPDRRYEIARPTGESAEGGDDA
ncbi:MAG: hypothetical protein IJV41_00700 [Oscillospiraceae bacterium]|nr:hypothetical protein [Oscillospiraceae bacterium]